MYTRTSLKNARGYIKAVAFSLITYLAKCISVILRGNSQREEEETNIAIPD